MAQTITGTYGTFSINTAGAWTYTADNSQVAIQGLNTGDGLSDQFMVTTIDGTTQRVTITINGTDEPSNISPIARPDGVHLSFDGNDLITMADDPSLQMTNNVTMEAWINHSGSGTGSQIIVNKEGEYELGITADTGEIKYAIADSLSAWSWHNTGYFVTAGEWTHVAVTFDGVVGEINTYINGSPVDTFAQSGPIGDVYSTYDDLTIGGRQNASDQRFQGLIDEVRVWSTTRSQAELQSNMNGLLTGAEAGLAGNWRLDEGSTGVVVDQSANGNSGTLGGAEGMSATPSYRGYYTDEDTQLIIPAGSGVLANDNDDDGDTLSVTNLDTTGMLGTLVLNNADGSFTYDPIGALESLRTGDHVIETFTYTANDGSGDSNTVTVTITVMGVNDAPTMANTIADQSATEDVAFSFTFPTNTFNDVDGDSLTYTSDASGWLTFNSATRTFSGTPANADVGTVSIIVRATDGAGAFVEDQFDITVANANNPPVIAGANTGAVTKNVDPDGDGQIEVGGVLTISDPDPAESSFQAGTVVGVYGSLTIDAAGNWNYAADNTQAVIQQLNTGESISDVLTVTTADGTTHSIIVTINGATAIVDQGGDDPGPGPGVDPIEPDQEPEPELPPDEDLPVDLELPPHEELAISYLASSGTPVITPLQWADPTYFVPTISMLTTDNMLSTDDGSPSAMVSIVKYLQRELASETIERVASKVAALFSADAMTQTLDHIHQQLDDTLAMDGKRGKLIIGAATGLGASVFAGYVIWAFRGSSLVLGALTAMPMWRCFDPLPVLMGDDKKRQDRGEGKSTEHELDNDETTVKELLGDKQAARDIEDLSRRND